MIGPIEVGSLCRSRDAIVKTLDEDRSRICRVIAAVPRERWRHPETPEFKVELLAMPVTAYRRVDDLVPIEATPGLESSTA